MKIAIDGQTLASPDANRGIGVYLRHLLRHLADVPSVRYELMRWGSDRAGLPDPELLPSYRIPESMAGAGFGAALSRYQLRSQSVRKFVREHAIDALFNPNPLQAGVEAMARPGLVPLVATVHDLTPLVLPDLFLGTQNAPFEAFYRERLNHLISHANALIADSEATRQDIIRFTTFPAARVSVVYPGCDPIFRPDADAASDAAALKQLNRRITQQSDHGIAAAISSGKYLLTVGGYNPKKNFQTLFPALGKMDKKLLADLPLVLSGPLNDQDWEILTNLRNHHAPDVQLVRAGYTDDAMLAVLYRHAVLLAFPSLHEGFGLPALEAMASGCPVVAGNSGSLPEVVGSAGLLCDPNSADSIAEAIERLLKSQTERDDRKRLGIEQARPFTWRRTAEGTTEAIEIAAESRASFAVSAKAGGEVFPKSRLLWYSPLPRDPGGVSAYSASMLHEIAPFYQITLVRESGAKPTSLEADFPVVTPEVALKLETDLPVYHMGNNLEQCGFTWKALQTWPGLTIVHDLNIHGFLLEYHVRSQAHVAAAEDHPYHKALQAAHGRAGADQALQVLVNKALPDIAQFPAHRLLTVNSQALITHSRWGRDQLEANGDAAPVFTLPLGIEHPLPVDSDQVAAVRREAGGGEGDLVIVCGGYLEPNRRLDSVILALSQLKIRGIGARLILAGQVEASHQRWLESLAAERGVADLITWTGFMADDQQFLATLAASDVVVHLRHPTNGETSATILRALSMGRPVIVSATDSYRELPESCCWKVDADHTEIELLTSYLTELARRPELRHAMSSAARRHIALYHAWPEAAGRFRAIVDQVVAGLAGGG